MLALACAETSAIDSDATETSTETRATDTAEDAGDVARPPANIAEVLADCTKTPDPYPNELEPGEELARVTLTAEDARCNDGTPAQLYVRAAPVGSAGRNRWILYLQGGASCRTYGACTQRYCGIDTFYDASKLSTRWNPLRAGARGILRRNDDNPLGGANEVYLYYCSSDQWTGRNDAAVLSPPASAPAEFAPYSIIFRGHTILARALETLSAGVASADDGSRVDLASIDAAEIVLLTGSSAGSVGVQNNLDWAAARLSAHGAAVFGVLDAAAGAQLRNDSANPARPDDTAELQSEWDFIRAASGYAGFVDESCVDRQSALGTPWRCADSATVILNHLTTPFFVRQDLWDVLQRKRWVDLGLGSLLPARNAEHLAAIRQLRATALEKDGMTRDPGVYGPYCGQHIALNDDDFFAKQSLTDGDGHAQTFRSLLLAWLQGAAVQVIDDPDAKRSECP
jgi:hypothetical protein